MNKNIRFLSFIFFTFTIVNAHEFIDSIAYDIALSLKLNPYQEFYFKINEKDILSSLSTKNLSKKLLERLSVFSKLSTYSDVLEDNLGVWSIFPTSRDGSDLRIQLDIFNNGQIVFSSKEFAIVLKDQLNNKQNNEKVFYKKSVYDKVKKIDANKLSKTYKPILDNEVPYYQKVNVYEILFELFNIKISTYSNNSLKVNNYGDLSFFEDDLIIRDVFSYKYLNNISNIKVYVLQERGDFLEHYRLNNYYSNIVKNINNFEIYNVDNILFPNNIYKDNTEYCWGDSYDFKRSFCGLNDFQIEKNKDIIALVFDDLDHSRLWQISLNQIRLKTEDNNWIGSFSFFSIDDFEVKSESSIARGNYSLRFKNYKDDANLKIEKVVEFTERDLNKYLIERISGISKKLKLKIKEIIITRILNKEFDYAER